MTKKEINRLFQTEINSQAEKEFNLATEGLFNSATERGTRLRTCSASVFETEGYYILCSYRTLIACINKETRVGYDMLRNVYGYTSTSSQHVSKFMHDYGAIQRLTWRAVC